MIDFNIHGTPDELKHIMNQVFNECHDLRAAGQKEYAGSENAFGNFVRLAIELETTPEKVLWTYAIKHRDGIASWLRGHESQREDVTGRINDFIVYLCILRGMIEARRHGGTLENWMEAF
jgi:hypothetical protein